MKMGIHRYILFTTSVLVAVFIAISVYYFTQQRHKNATLLLSDLRKEMVESSHMLSSKLDSHDSIAQYESFFARKSANSDYINAFMIADEQKVFLTTDKHFRQVPSSDNVCTDLHQADAMTLLSKAYYKQRIVFYENSSKQIVYLYVILNHEKIEEYLNTTMQQALVIFITILFAIGILLFLYHRHYLIHPLELLRQFAYYQSKVPPSFSIMELEYIRSSLVQTFKRLDDEKKELYELSRVDQLSGLLNRNALHERSNWLIAEAARKNTQFAVLFLDLDHFKDVNDSLGHKIGDELLKTVASYLQEVIRSEDFIARVGGDEFVAVINSFDSHLELTRVIQRLLDRIKEPFVIESHPIYVSASIGVVLYPKDGNDMQTLLKHADIAMYEAKRKGRDQYHFFTSSLNQKVQEDIQLEKDLRNAIKNHEFQLHYQPKVDLMSGEIIGAEALIRWFHPDKTLVSPDRFIPLCEHNGFIVTVGEWVIHEAIRQQLEWKHHGVCDIPISINVSVKQLHDDHFVDKLSSIIHKTGISEEKIDIEITENMFLENSERNLHIMKHIREQGMSISLDDFGTGYSSLSYLKKFPMDTLKIDKSFMDDYQSHTGAMFIKTIVEIGKTLGLTVVAEGVEVKEQMEYLKEIGCDAYQGYYCSKPLDADAFAVMVQNHASCV